MNLRTTAQGRARLLVNGVNTRANTGGVDERRTLVRLPVTFSHRFRVERSELHLKGLVCVVFASLFALLLAGCATEVGGFTYLKGPRPAKPANYPIDVFTNGLPTRAFDRVAILDVHCESQGFMTPNLESDAIPMLIKQARAAGCDAVIDIQQRKPSNWTLETRTIQVTAVGVAYQ
ncbi:MAG TPA: hypothetical protein PLX89_10095 [Verrucomicrobiota bacterium]|nr:hypothetical protein [Verrucomicrobiota bacterium]